MEWSDAEIKLYIDNEGRFNSYVINRRLESRSLTPLMTFTTPVLIPAALNNLLSIAKLPLPINITIVSNNLPTAKPPLSINTPNTRPTEAKATTYGRDLATLAKMYTEESKYSGEDDNFDRKLTIFNDLCDRVGIPQEAKIKGLPTILRSIALDFYYRNKATYITFDGIG